MGRLSGKNILIIMPKDYYNEEELDIPYEIFKSEDANIIIASGKMKEAVGMKTGRRMPDRLIIDSMEVLDRPVIVAYLMVVVFMFILINLVVDILYSILDPRIRLREVR